jgi:hypothetical protein
MTRPTPDAIRAVLDSHPTLGGSGWHTRSAVRGWGWDDRPGRADRDLEDLRSDHSITVIAAVAEWLSQWRTIKAAHAGSPHSYMLKHYAEMALTCHPDVLGYVSNGQLIAAAYVIAYPVAHCYPNSPDSEIGIRVTELKKMPQQRVRTAP